jgi:hypothetical protein
MTAIETGLQQIPVIGALKLLVIKLMVVKLNMTSLQIALLLLLL